MNIARQELADQAASLAVQGVYIGTSLWKYPGWCGMLHQDEAECEKLWTKFRVSSNTTPERGSMRELHEHRHRGRYIRIRKVRLRKLDRIENELSAVMGLSVFLTVLLAPCWYALLLLTLLMPRQRHGVWQVSRH